MPMFMCTCLGSKKTLGMFEDLLECISAECIYNMVFSAGAVYSRSSNYPLPLKALFSYGSLLWSCSF